MSVVAFLLFIPCNTSFAQEQLRDYEIKLNKNNNVIMNKTTFKELLGTIDAPGSPKKMDYCCACTGMTPASLSVIKAYGDAHAAAMCYSHCCYQDICSYGCRRGKCNPSAF